MKPQRSFWRTLIRGLAHFFVSLFGILGWLIHGMLQLLAGTLILCALIGLIVYAKVKPDLDYCREVAYDKLAQMERQDFQMLSDTEIYDKNDQLIGLINAGHYEYTPIQDISMNIQKVLRTFFHVYIFEHTNATLRIIRFFNKQAL